MIPLFSVLNRAKKEGIRISKPEIEDAVESVTKFMHKAKADIIGDFPSKSRTVQPSTDMRAKAPEFWKDIVNYSDIHTGGCLTVSISGQINIAASDYKCDLLLSSDDLNSCYFHRKLARCMINERFVMYIEVTKLTIRGSERLLGMLKDCRKLFDSRCWIILLTGKNTLSQDITKLVDLSLSEDMTESLAPSSKKFKNNNYEISSKTDELKTMNEKLNASKNDVVRFQVQLQEVIGNESKLLSENQELKKKLDGFKTVIDIRNNDIKQLDIQLQEAIVNESKLLSENQELKKKLDEFKTVIDIGNTDIKQLDIQLKDSTEKIAGLSFKNKALSNEVQKLRSLGNCQAKSLPDVSESNSPQTVPNATQTSPKKQTKIKQQHTKLDKKTMEVEISKKLKLKILEIEEKFVNAGPAEILHRSCNKFEYEAKFSVKLNVSDNYICTLKIKSCDLEQYSRNNWEGRGRSKAVAKADAMLSLLNTIKG